MKASYRKNKNGLYHPVVIFNDKSRLMSKKDLCISRDLAIKIADTIITEINTRKDTNSEQ